MSIDMILGDVYDFSKCKYNGIVYTKSIFMKKNVIFLFLHV